MSLPKPIGSASAPSPALFPSRAQPRIAIVGSGIAGLAAAHTLQGLADLTLFEADGHFGGELRSVDLTLPNAQGQPTALTVDLSALVFGEHSDPNLTALAAQLGLRLQPSERSFSVQLAGAGPRGEALEWASGELAGVFSQPRQLLNPRFWHLLTQVWRFQRQCAALAEEQAATPPGAAGPWLQSLGDWLRAQHYSSGFTQAYLLPVLGGLWGGPTEELLRLPIAAALHWCQRQGRRSDQGGHWHTLAGGAQAVVQAIVGGIADARRGCAVHQVLRDGAGVRLVSDGQVERFDAVLLACHADQALAMLGEGASEEERGVLGGLRFQSRSAVLHTDRSVLPRARSAWAVWNGELGAARGAEAARAGAHVLLNRLQALPIAQPLLVSLDPLRPIDPAQVLHTWTQRHPVFDVGALRAQARVPRLQGQGHTWYAGAWCGHGFHEDGLKAGLHAARALIDRFELVPRISERLALRQALPGVLA